MFVVAICATFRCWMSPVQVEDDEDVSMIVLVFASCCCLFGEKIWRECLLMLAFVWLRLLAWLFVGEPTGLLEGVTSLPMF